jgi:hypothetical protein
MYVQLVHAVHHTVSAERQTYTAEPAASRPSEPVVSLDQRLLTAHVAVRRAILALVAHLETVVRSIITADRIRHIAVRGVKVRLGVVRDLTRT